VPLEGRLVSLDSDQLDVSLGGPRLPPGLSTLHAPSFTRQTKGEIVEVPGRLPAIRIRLLTVLAGAEVLCEERQDEILEPNRDGAGVGAGVDLERIGNAVAVKDLVQFARIGP